MSRALFEPLHKNWSILHFGILLAKLVLVDNRVCLC